jgi:hypothetical protein
MSNERYQSYVNRCLGSGPLSAIDWTADTIKAALCRSADYTPNLSADTTFADIPSIAVVSTCTLATPTVTAGIIDFADALFPLVAAGAACDLVVVYKDTGTPSTSPLALLFDTFPAGMPVTPDGTDITVVLDVAGLYAA